MSITIDFSPASMALIKKQAMTQNTTAEEFIRAASEKAARNAEYLAGIERAKKNADAGNCTYLTDDELRGIVYGN